MAENKITVKGKDRWGKDTIHIPDGVNRSLKIKINKVLRAFFEEEGMQKETDHWGKTDYPIWKYFGKVKFGKDQYSVDELVLRPLIDLLKENEYDVSAMEKLAEEGSVDEDPEVTVEGVKENKYKQKQLYINVPLRPGLSFKKSFSDVWGDGVWYGGDMDGNAILKVNLDKIKDTFQILEELNMFALEKFEKYLEENTDDLLDD